MIQKRQTASIDAVLQLVADQRRRTIIEYLMANGDRPVAVGELADAISGSDAPQGRIDLQHGEGIALHHTHLPKLDAHGIVDYDPQRRTVTYRSKPRVEALVRFVSEVVE